MCVLQITIIINLIIIIIRIMMIANAIIIKNKKFQCFVSSMAKEE